MAANFAAKAVLAASAFQAVGQIQNARFQADLAEKNIKERRKRAEFEKAEAEISLEASRLNLAQERRQRLKASNKDIAAIMARPLTASKDVIQGNIFADLVDDLAVIRTEEQIRIRKVKAGVSNLMAGTYAQADMDRAAAKANRQAAIISAATTVAGGYFQYKYLGGGSTSMLNPNSTATMSAAQLDMGIKNYPVG